MASAVRCHTMRFGSTAKVLAECKLKDYRISECARLQGIQKFVCALPLMPLAVCPPTDAPSERIMALFCKYQHNPHMVGVWTSSTSSQGRPRSTPWTPHLTPARIQLTMQSIVQAAESARQLRAAVEHARGQSRAGKPSKQAWLEGQWSSLLQAVCEMALGRPMPKAQQALANSAVQVHLPRHTLRFCST